MINSWQAYFIFSEKERKGIVVIGIILSLSIIFSLFTTPKKESAGKIASTESIKPHLFTFNPNTIDSAEAISLGIPVKQVNTLLRYRNKGGRFRKKEDILKLYGLDPDIAHQLIPFIELTFNDENQRWRNYTTINKKSSYKTIHEEAYKFSKWKNKENSFANRVAMKRGASNWTIDINEADANEWHIKTSLPMNVVQQIINYKNYLGGFTHPLQLNKVYGLTDSSLQSLRPHLLVQRNFIPLRNSSNMNFSQWKSLGIFDDQQIFEILKMRKQQGGRLSWRKLVILFDLPEKQALWLKSQIVISD